jgi:signal transduction histidine kinase
LKDSQSRWLKLTHQIESAAFEQGHTDWLGDFIQDTTRRLGSPVKLDALERIDRVDQLQTWLEASRVESPWELAPGMVNFGWEIESLEKLRNDLSPSLFTLSIQWLGMCCLMMGLLSEVLHTTERISRIVHAVKSYAYLDQAPLLEVDVHEGLENTLVIMLHKLKKGVTVKREYATDLPRIQAYASELNQVWTNIIDNAVDAMNGKGEIKIKTYKEDQHVIIEISDSGPGIPEDIQSRIFEPFFTTKAPGQGTGLGLHISHDIIANRHHGQLTVESKPGETKFRVVLPIKINR